MPKTLDHDGPRFGSRPSGIFGAYGCRILDGLEAEHSPAQILGSLYGLQVLGANLSVDTTSSLRYELGRMSRGAANTSEPLSEDWELLVSFLPANWEELARTTGALRKLRKDKSPSNYLRTLMLHFGYGYSLRETVVRARRAQLADLSDVAFLKRLRKARDWLRALCVELLREQGLAAASTDGFQVRAFDATTVQEPGPSGSLWRIHYSLRLPSLTCDFFKLTRTKGAGTRESFEQFPIAPGDCIVADWGHLTGTGLRYVVDAGGQITVRVNSRAADLEGIDGKPLDLVQSVGNLQKPTVVGFVPARAVADRGEPLPGRVCALRKTDEAARMARRNILRDAAGKGRAVQAATLELARYVIVFTTVPEGHGSAAEVLEWYRTRWQMERVFKRFKSLALLGSLPKYNNDSAKAWVYGKLLAALLVDKLIRHASTLSPWGYELESGTTAQPLA